MTGSPRVFRAALRGLGIFFLAIPFLTAQPAAAVDIVSRGSEAELLLEQKGRLRGLRLTIEVRFLTVDGAFLERVGVDFSGVVSGQVTKNGGSVEGAKLILEAFKVEKPMSVPVVTRTGRQTVTTNGSGGFQLRLKDLVDAQTRADILSGDVSSLLFEATGKNGKRVDRVHFRADTALGGLLE